MFSGISWQWFLTILILVTVIYYLIVVFIYYRNFLKSLRLAKIKIPLARKFFPKQPGKKEDDLFDRALVLSKILRANIHEAGKKQSPKEELLFSVQNELKNHHDIIGTAFQIAINNLVEDCSLKECSIYLSEEDLGSIWKN